MLSALIFLLFHQMFFALSNLMIFLLNYSVLYHVWKTYSERIILRSKGFSLYLHYQSKYI